MHEQPVGVFRVGAERASTAVVKPLVQSDGFGLKVSGFEHEKMAAAGLCLCFQPLHQRACDTFAPVAGQREHSLQLPISVLEHDSPTSRCMARWVASDRKDDIGLRQGGHVDTVVTLCGGGGRAASDKPLALGFLIPSAASST